VDKRILPGGQTIKPLRVVANVTVFLVSFVAAMAVTYRIFPYPYPNVVREKMNHFEQHKDEYDVVFVGTCYVGRQIDPDLFDMEIEERGGEVRSFNLGVGGTVGHEITAFLEHILAMKPARLKHVLMDFRWFSPEIAEKNQFTDRTVWWHSFSRTKSICTSRRVREMPRAERLDLIGLHVKHMSMHYTRVGKGEEILMSFPWVRKIVGAAPDAPLENEGFHPVEMTKWNYKKRDKIQARYLEDVETIRRSSQNDFSVKAPSQLSEQVEIARRADVEPIYLISPLPKVSLFRQTGGIRTITPTLFAFNDPVRYPALFDLENRHDRTHINPSGAEEYTKRIAEHFADHLSLPSEN